METYLQKISPGIKQVSAAISAALETDVTIVDNQLIRITGTGPYEKSINQPIPETSVFAKILKQKKPTVVDNPGENELCLDCQRKEDCIEAYLLCTPIFWSDEVVGVIGISACDKEQEKILSRKKDQYFSFLNRMADLIGSKIGEVTLFEQASARNQELETIIQNVDNGVLCVNKDGKISQVNNKAIELLGRKNDDKPLSGKLLKDIWPESLLLQAINQNREYNDQEEFFKTSGETKRFMSSVHLIKKEGEILGAVGSFSDLEVVHRSVYRIMERPENISFADIIGNSSTLENAKQKAKKVASSDSTVMILGESGTGKELFARAIHNASNRNNFPFVSINCSAIPETLLESELFGYEPGAFTGADKKGKPGKMELAHKGTLFLDEIGDMPLFLQAKLLRALQEKKTTRLGGVKTRDINIRIVTATNKNLEDLIEKNLFREELFFRLNVVPIVLPPLRERIEDIPELTEQFLTVFNNRFGKNILGFATSALENLKLHSWPGNVRELENLVEFAINFSEGPYINLDVIKERLQTGSTTTANQDKVSLKKMVKKFEKETLLNFLEKNGWDEGGKARTAEELGISRATLYRKISQL